MHLSLAPRISIYAFLFIGFALANNEMAWANIELESISGPNKGRVILAKNLDRSPAFIFESDIDPSEIIQDEEPNEFVIVEPTPVYPVSTQEGYKLLPYPERRPKWGLFFQISYSLFEPEFYEPSFILFDFETVYGSAELPLIELTWNIKRNYSALSIGAEIGVGFYNNEADDLISSNLTLIPIRLGGRVNFDNLFSDYPYVVPYATAGAYIMIFREELDTITFNGTTQASIYGAGGIMIQLDWIDRQAAYQNLMEAGIHNSFLYIEGRKFVASSAEQDPDFETEIHLSAGFALEF